MIIPNDFSIIPSYLSGITVVCSNSNLSHYYFRNGFITNEFVNITVLFFYFSRSKTLNNFSSAAIPRRGVSLLPGRLVKSRSVTFNSTEVIERSLRLATALLHPKICYIIAYLSSALVECSVVDDDLDLPLCSPEYVRFCCTLVKHWFGLLSSHKFHLLRISKYCYFEYPSSNVFKSFYIFMFSA